MKWHQASFRSAPHLSLPPTIASTSASTSDRLWALSTTIRLLSSSTARSKAHTWNTSVPPLSSSRRKFKPVDPFQWRTKRSNRCPLSRRGLEGKRTTLVHHGVATDRAAKAWYHLKLMITWRKIGVVVSVLWLIGL